MEIGPQSPQDQEEAFRNEDRLKRVLQMLGEELKYWHPELYWKARGQHECRVRMSAPHCCREIQWGIEDICDDCRSRLQEQGMQ